ncbi:hypothetical protein TcasGA2_TC008046 [Tribolium castaneum]|uniref:Uncharacterized protein n=1 Tax=Tribolium castaneum TaxID=7070 RepID=D1ZZH7_TRICA|nr:hypothetical protein TcasGA2_TC008046 [Tribolium castaneum]
MSHRGPPIGSGSNSIRAKQFPLPRRPPEALTHRKSGTKIEWISGLAVVFCVFLRTIPRIRAKLTRSEGKIAFGVFCNRNATVATPKTIEQQVPSRPCHFDQILSKLGYGRGRFSIRESADFYKVRRCGTKMHFHNSRLTRGVEIVSVRSCSSRKS